MSEDTQKSPTEAPTPRKSDLALSGASATLAGFGLPEASATLGVASVVFWFVPFLGHLAVHGFPAALTPSPLMDLGFLLSIGGFVLGVIAAFRKGRKSRVRIGIYTSAVVLLMALVFPALSQM